MLRRTLAYFLDSIVVSALFQFFLLSCSVVISINQIGFFRLYFISIILSFGYYTLLWTSSIRRTVGQFLCQIQIKDEVNTYRCIKRLMYLHLASFFYWCALSYMSFRQLVGDAANIYLIFMSIIVIILHLLYALNINKIDRVSGIEVIFKR